MTNFKVTLENLSTKKEFKIRLTYWSKTSEEIRFKFSNSDRWIEARCIKVQDKEGNFIPLSGGAIVNPIDRTPIVTTISDTKPFVAEIKGDIEYWADNMIYLNMLTAKYLLKKGEPYYFSHIFEDDQSEKIEIIFK